MRAGVAAGHPATCEAGVEILEDGGTAADAAVAACLASCVAETVMTGLLGGGHAIYWDARLGRAPNLDCFVVGSLGSARRDGGAPGAVRRGARPLRDRRCVVRRAGLPRGWALHADGRLPWERLVEPALRLARDGVAMPPAHVAASRCSRR